LARSASALLLKADIATAEQPQQKCRKAHTITLFLRGCASETPFSASKFGPTFDSESIHAIHVWMFQHWGTWQWDRAIAGGAMSG
jgi:hypothetical protein